MSLNHEHLEAAGCRTNGAREWFADLHRRGRLHMNRVRHTDARVHVPRGRESVLPGRTANNTLA